MEDEDARKRPVWVWIIGIYFLGSTALALLGFYIMLGTHLPIPPAQRALFDSLTTFDWIVTIVNMVCNVAGAIALLLLRRIAPLLFTAAFGVGLLHTFWELATNDPHLPSVWLMAIGFGIGLAIIVYAFRLRDRGVLA
jgi:hypothetical protein